MEISVVVPVFNEEATIETVHQRIKETEIPSEIIYVDDGSTDMTQTILQKLAADSHVKVITFIKNQGKGRALSAGIKSASGDVVILQDADLEYDPVEYPQLIAPFRDNSINIVYGARFVNRTWSAFYLPHYVANKLLTAFTNILFGSKLNDMETGYKVFRKSIYEDLNIQAKRFEFEPEFTAKVLLKRYQIIEVPINFNPRNYKQGKKIKFGDAITALGTLVKIKFSQNPFL